MCTQYNVVTLAYKNFINDYCTSNWWVLYKWTIFILITVVILI